MGIKQINYSCGGTSTDKRILKSQIDEGIGEVSNFIYYSGPCDPISGDFFPEHLEKTIALNEQDITNHIEGIKLMLSNDYNVTNPVFKFG